jgi:hypothetical protein
MADLLTNLAAVAGAAGGDGAYIEDVFSTYLYAGNSSTQTITNGIDLDGEGGLVWLKGRNGAGLSNNLFDTARGAFNVLFSNADNSQISDVNKLSSFNSDGFAIGADGQINNSSYNYASWTFRKAPKFFDVVTYTGTGVARTVSHNLGSVPGCIIVKRTDTDGNWQVYHRANTASPETDYLVLNSTAATVDSDTRWNDTAPTDSVFTVGTEATVNASGGTYVAYLWAHDAGGFGDSGSDNVVTCGSYTGNGSTSGPVITLGYEPQWLLIKRTDNARAWYLLDNMRGLVTGSTGDVFFEIDTSAAESNASNAYVGLSPTGFFLETTAAGFNASGGTYIYIAIRRGPMKTPTAGTEVFEPKTWTGTGANASPTGGNFPPDLFLSANRNTTINRSAHDRLRGIGLLVLNLTNSEDTGYTNSLTSFNMTGISVGVDTSAQTINYSGNTYVQYYFGRAPGFMDVVAYTGTGATLTVNHNLGVIPELIIAKNRTTTSNWPYLYDFGVTNMGYAFLNLTSAGGNDTYASVGVLTAKPTASSMTLSSSGSMNTSGNGHVAYLFASLAGVSKVGSYTGNGTSVSVTTGFQPRFILVKRTDSTGNWIVGDSARGLVAGDDPALFLNSTAAETTGQDWVDVSATGFTVNETALNANVNTGTYLYLAIS